MRINGVEAGWPSCAICKKPCDSVETEQDRIRGGIKVRAHHHGAVDEIVLTEQNLETLNGSPSFRFCEAFATKALPAS
jgi:hypothetical protein